MPKTSFRAGGADRSDATLERPRQFIEPCPDSGTATTAPEPATPKAAAATATTSIVDVNNLARASPPVRRAPCMRKESASGHAALSHFRGKQRRGTHR